MKKYIDSETLLQSLKDTVADISVAKDQYTKNGSVYNALSINDWVIHKLIKNIEVNCKVSKKNEKIKV